MAHITEFTIEGLAGRTEPYSRKLNRDVNVFFGLNGAGKTSLLRILQSAMSRDGSMLDTVPFERAEVKIYSVDYDKIFAHTIERPHPKHSKAGRGRQTVPSPEHMPPEMTTGMMFAGETFVYHEEIRWNVTPPLPKDSRGGWSHGWLPTTRVFFGRLPSWRLTAAQQQLYTERAVDRLFAEALSALWSSYSARLLSQVRKAQEAGLSNILQAVLSPPKKSKTKRRLDSTTAYNRIITFLRRQGAEGTLGPLEVFAAKYAEDPQLVSVADHIDRVEQDIEKASAPRAKLENLIRRMFSGPKELQFSDTTIKVLAKDGRDIGLAALSSGEKQVLRIFTELLHVGGSAVLIDEPEISLHIDWQRELIKSMQLLSPDSQLVLATHSPEIMADLSDSRIFRL